MLWCDGRRTVELPPGARVEVRRGAVPVRLARLHHASFTDRLVAKFALPVSRVARARRTDAARGARVPPRVPGRAPRGPTANESPPGR